MNSIDQLRAISRSVFPHFPHRAVLWELRSRTLTFGRRPKLMGIINVTPDSFSDGGEYFEPERAVERGLQMVDQGADILDVGGESTRPYSATVEENEELRRVTPVVARLCECTDTPVSVDTSKAAVAREALAAGAEIINDVTGLEGDPAMLPLAVEAAAGVCAMHMRGTPQTMQDDPKYDNVVEDVCQYLRGRRDVLMEAGISAERICLDPGIGFGKTHHHNLTLLANSGSFHRLASPLLVGPSRKAFIGKVIGNREADRLAGTIGVAAALAQQGVQIIRVHDVAPVRQALQLFEATGGVDGREHLPPSSD